MPLVNPISEDTNSEITELAKFFNETLGFCPNSVLTMMHRPKIAKAFINLNMAVMENQGRVTSSLKRLVAYVSSNVTGCRYCQAHSIRAAERYNTEQDKLDNIWNYRTHPSFSEAERVALDFSVAASTIPNGLDVSLHRRLHQHWSEEEIVELLGVISLFGYLNRWNDSMATTLEDDSIASGKSLLGRQGWEIGKHR